jgi:hypothetical protein
MLRVGNVTVSLPPEIRVVEDGESVSLQFRNFTGSISLVAPPSSAKRRDTLASSSEEVPISKRARQESESPADESEASAPNLAASAMRTVPQEVFRNGGLSQDDSDDDDSPMPAPRAISWEEASNSAMPPPPPSFTIPAEFEPSPTNHNANAGTPLLSRSAQQAAATAAAASDAGSSAAHRLQPLTVPGRADDEEPLREGEAAAQWPAQLATAASVGQQPSALASVRPALEIDGGVAAADAAAAAVPSVSPERLAALLQNPDSLVAGTAASIPSSPGAAAAAGAAATAGAPAAAAAAGSGPSDAPGLATRGDLAAYPFGRGEKLDVWEWEEVRTTGAVPTPRWGHCCAALSGALYVMGGDDLTDADDDILRELHRLEPATGEWKRCRDAPHGRCWHSGTVVGGSVAGNSDILLVFGGETLTVGDDGKVAPGTERAALNTMLSYDPYAAPRAQQQQPTFPPATQPATQPWGAALPRMPGRRLEGARVHARSQAPPAMPLPFRPTLLLLPLC